MKKQNEILVHDEDEKTKNKNVYSISKFGYVFMLKCVYWNLPMCERFEHGYEANVLCSVHGFSAYWIIMIIIIMIVLIHSHRVCCVQCAPRFNSHKFCIENIFRTAVRFYQFLADKHSFAQTDNAQVFGTVHKL